MRYAELSLLLPYAVFAGIMGGLTRHAMRFHGDEDRAIACFFAALLWPIAVFIWIAIIAIAQTQRKADGIARQGAEKHRGQIARIKSQMMEDDLERFGGNESLAIQFDYETCPVCYGAGGGGGRTCPRCGGKRVIRIRNGVEE